MAGCELDFSALPILTGCPGPSETFLVGNAVGGLDANGMNTVGYARRMWSDLATCVLEGIVFTFLDFIVGDTVLNAGATVLVINVENIIEDSIWITLGGSEMPRNDSTQRSYLDPVYTSGSVTITFNAPVQDGDQFIVHYATS